MRRLLLFLLALIPLGGQAHAAADDVDLSFWQNRKDLIQAPPPPKAEPLPLPQITRWKMKNGLDVIVVPRPELPVVSLAMMVKAGGYDEDGKSLGVADFTAGMLRKGTDTRSAEEIADAIDFVGGSLEAGADSEHTSVACTALVKDQPLCLDLLADVLMRPTFPEGEMQEIRDQILASLGELYDTPSRLAEAHFDNLVFGDDHPEGRAMTPERVKAIGRDNLVRFWKQTYRPNNSILTIAGAVDPAKVKDAIDAHFERWEEAPVPPRPKFQVPERQGSRLLLVDKDDLTQATMVFGHRGPSHNNPEWYAATLVNYVLGGSDFSSRLMIELRSKRGLTYGISSTFGASLYDGAFQVSASTRNETLWPAFITAVGELRKMKAEGPSQIELDKAKAFYAGSYPFGLQSAASVASHIMGAELHGLGIAYVKLLAVRLAHVELERAKLAARDFLQPEHMVVVIVGRGDVIAPQLQKNGMKFERISYRDPISNTERARLRHGKPPSMASDESRKAMALLKQGLDAQGGAAHLGAIKTLVVIKSGVRSQGGASANMLSTTYYGRPDRVRIEQEISVGGDRARSVVVVTPKEVKGGGAGEILHKVPPANETRLRASVFEDINFLLLNLLGSKVAPSVQLAPSLAEGNRNLDGAIVKMPDGETLTLYFDRATHLLARIKAPVEGGGESIEDIDDYRATGGVKFSYRQRTRGQASSEAAVTEIKVNPPISPAMFE